MKLDSLPNRYPLEQVRIQNLKNYLKDRGWVEEPFGRVTALKFKSPQSIRESKYLEILIPSKRELIDYTRIIEIAIEAISAFEGRSFGDVLSQVLKGEILKEKRELIGYVFQLRRKEGEKAKIGILTFSEDEARPVTIKLDDKSYQLAIDAHKDSKMIRLTGILEKTGKGWYLNEPEGMEIIDEDCE